MPNDTWPPILSDYLWTIEKPLNCRNHSHGNTVFYRGLADRRVHKSESFYTAQKGLELANPLTSDSQVLGPQACPSVLCYCEDALKVGHSSERNCKTLSRWASLILAGTYRSPLLKLPVSCPSILSGLPTWWFIKAIDWHSKSSGSSDSREASASLHSEAPLKLRRESQGYQLYNLGVLPEWSPLQTSGISLDLCRFLCIVPFDKDPFRNSAVAHPVSLTPTLRWWRLSVLWTDWGSCTTQWRTSSPKRFACNALSSVLIRNQVITGWRTQNSRLLCHIW